MDDPDKLYRLKGTGDIVRIDPFESEVLRAFDPGRVAITNHTMSNAHPDYRPDPEENNVAFEDLTEIKTYAEIIGLFKNPERFPHLHLKIEAWGVPYVGIVVSIKRKRDHDRSTDTVTADGITFQLIQERNNGAPPTAILCRFTEPRNDSTAFTDTWYDTKDVVENTYVERRLGAFRYQNLLLKDPRLLDPAVLGDQCAAKAQSGLLKLLADDLAGDYEFMLLCKTFEVDHFGRVHSKRRHQIGPAYARTAVLPGLMGTNTQTVDDLVIRKKYGLRSPAFLDLASL